MKDNQNNQSEQFTFCRRRLFPKYEEKPLSACVNNNKALLQDWTQTMRVEERPISDNVQSY